MSHPMKTVRLFVTGKPDEALVAMYFGRLIADRLHVQNDAKKAVVAMHQKPPPDALPGDSLPVREPSPNPGKESPPVG